MILVTLYVTAWVILLWLVSKGKAEFFLADYDGWIGYFIDRRSKKWLRETWYVCLLPYCVFRIRRVMK